MSDRVSHHILSHKKNEWNKFVFHTSNQYVHPEQNQYDCILR
jgi:hypothetical protein